MTKKSVEGLFAEWRGDAGYIREYDALDGEFALAEALISARRMAGLSQKELAERIATDQSNVSKWESGRVLPSTRTLQRIAEVTGNRLSIGFVPVPGEAKIV